MKALRPIIAVLMMAAATCASHLEDGVLVVDGVLKEDGRPFFPIGSWNWNTSPEDIARLGMNTAHLGVSGRAERLEEDRAFMRRCAELGIQVVWYLPYGGHSSDGAWPEERVRVVAGLASEPNLLAWNIGDDIYLGALPGLERTARVLREATPTIPILADCAPAVARGEEAQRVFRESVDIALQYDYPLPNEEYPLPENRFRKHQRFFEEQRAHLGDPLWTWVQAYMWHWTGQDLTLAPEGVGPYPEPEQVRLLCHAEINRGVRGLLFFSHRELHLMPNRAAEVALFSHEARVVGEYLAAGKTTFDLPTSDPDLDATAFSYGGSVLISAALFRDSYNRWVDEGIVREVEIECPWSGDDAPKALLVATPDAVECAVSVGSRPGTVRVSFDSLELAGFVVLSTEEAELERVRRGVAAIPEKVRKLALTGATAQLQITNSVLWGSGAFQLRDISLSLGPVRASERCADALDEGRYGDAVREWRTVMRLCRVALDSAMRSAQARTEQVLPHERHFLDSPYGLHNLRGITHAPPPGDPWRFIRQWYLAGPFPLDRDTNDPDSIPPGFERLFPPETDDDLEAVFATVDGERGWRYAESDLSGRLDLLCYSETTADVLDYLRSSILAPEAMDVELGIGSNDGAKVWVNGVEVFSNPVPRGRKAHPHQERFTAHLNAGRNRVLVKVTNLGAGWQLFLAVNDPERRLRFEP